MDTKERYIQLFHSAAKTAAQWFSAHWDKAVLLFLGLGMLSGLFWYAIRYIPEEEAALRRSVVNAAEQYLGIREADGSHEIIVDRYNTYSPSPRGYTLTTEDNWCAAFSSVAAMDAGLTDWIPVECSCQEQIALFDRAGDWEENDGYLPRTGDYIYYVWDEWRRGDCTAWANHVGIVVETFGPVIKVIEGNKDDSVSYRYIFLNDITIRGYGLPDYRKLSATQ